VETKCDAHSAPRQLKLYERNHWGWIQLSPTMQKFELDQKLRLEQFATDLAN
jgi:hypothetical protein